MIDDLFKLSQNFLRIKNQDYKRYFFKEYNIENKLSIIIGQRGIGKTTFIIQYLLEKYKDIFTDKAIYVQADHFLVGKYSLYEIAEQFYNLGGRLICFDEIHKYSDWSKELKSINDTFIDLKIIASGSSALEVYKGTHDLSRRAIVYKMNGLSFREFIELSLGITLTNYKIKDVFENHQDISNQIIKIVEKTGNKILKLFQEYLKYGYYPYYREYKDKSSFYITIEQNIHTTLESDLISIYPTINGSSLKKIKRLLSIIAGSVPFTPDLKKIKNLLDVGDERTLKIYLKYLEDAGIIHTISKSGKGLKGLEKPDKIYLNNPTLIHAIKGLYKKEEIGNIRETFFINSVSFKNNLSVPKRGDFFINDKYTIEIGGKNKNYNQIKDIANSYLAIDDIEIGINNKIPLWLFGFLY